MSVQATLQPAALANAPETILPPVQHNHTAGDRHDDGLYSNGHVIPTEEELHILPRVAGTMPWTAYLLCAVEFAERASYYGCNQVFKNFIRGKLPVGGNGAGSPPRGSQANAGALGKGTVIASAMTDAFKFLAYAVPIFGGWLADAHWGRFKTIVVGVIICGIAHIIMVISAIPSVIQSGKAIGPFALSLYMLAIGAALFKPNISPTVLDQNPHTKPHVIVENGKKVIVDPEATSESIMLWFYLLVNIGGFVGVATSYLARYVGFWSAYLLPMIIYLMLPPLLYVINKKLVKKPPGGTGLVNFVRVNLLCLRKAGIRGIGRAGYWERATPTYLAANGDNRVVTWDDKFVDDVRRTMGACAIFAFFPIQQLNDGGIGAAANAQSVALTGNGVPNDLLDNLNPLAIIILIPIMNHGIYPLLRKMGIRFGPIKRMTFGFLLAAIGATGYVVLQHYIYKTSPCGTGASTCELEDGTAGVSPISLWVYAVPTIVTATSEVFVNITAFGIAYSRSPDNMKGFVMALNLFTTAISTAIGLACANAVQDPYIIWVFAGPAIVGFISAFAFYFIFRHLDNEDFFVTEDTHVAHSDSHSIDHHSSSSFDEKAGVKKDVAEVKV